MTNLYSLHRLPELLADAKRERLFGKIIFEFTDGDLRLIRKETTLKVSHNEQEDTSYVASHGR